MNKETKKKLDESIEWLIEQIQKTLHVNRERAISLIEQYLERNW